MKTIKLGIALLAFLAMTFNASAAHAIKIIGSFGPAITDPACHAYLTNAVMMIRTTGTLPVGAQTGPSDPRLLTMVGPKDLTISANPYYRGVFNPAAPFSGAHGGKVWWFIVGSSDVDDISILDTTAVMSSADANNVLKGTVTFQSTDAYADTAPGWKANGDRIPNGTSVGEKAAFFVVAVDSGYFPVSTSQDLTAVYNFFGAYPHWNTSCVATHKEVTAKLTLFHGAPTLTPFAENGKFKVTAEKDGDTATYQLQSASTLSGTIVWTNAGSIKSGETNTIGVLQDSPMFFVRYAPDPTVAQ